MAGGKRQREELEKFPKFRDAYIRAFDRMIAGRIEAGLPTEWETGEEVMEWWTSVKSDDSDEQLLLNIGGQE